MLCFRTIKVFPHSWLSIVMNLISSFLKYTKAVMCYTECSNKKNGSSSIVVYVLFQGQSGNNLSLGSSWPLVSSIGTDDESPDTGSDTRAEIR